jgi:hypothetical protein
MSYRRHSSNHTEGGEWCITKYVLIIYIVAEIYSGQLRLLVSCNARTNICT